MRWCTGALYFVSSHSQIHSSIRTRNSGYKVPASAVVTGDTPSVERDQAVVSDLPSHVAQRLGPLLRQRRGLLVLGGP